MIPPDIAFPAGVIVGFFTGSLIMYGIMKQRNEREDARLYARGWEDGAADIRAAMTCGCSEVVE